ncbi:MAG: hypothetical protein HY420_00930 [Candidatus Kerfeldbacteria bacterium]|nr:hypothetical protein [Candidatus Kerfeldbacteria bacterium]
MFLPRISGTVGLLGLLSFLSWAVYADYRRFEDAFEWTVTLLILLHPVAAWAAWRQRGFEAWLVVSGGWP